MNSFILLSLSCSALGLKVAFDPALDIINASDSFDEECGDRYNYKCWKKGGHSLDNKKGLSCPSGYHSMYLYYTDNSCSDTNNDGWKWLFCVKQYSPSGTDTSVIANNACGSGFWYTRNVALPSMCIANSVEMLTAAGTTKTNGLWHVQIGQTGIDWYWHKAAHGTACPATQSSTLGNSEEDDIQIRVSGLTADTTYNWNTCTAIGTGISHADSNGAYVDENCIAAATALKLKVVSNANTLTWAITTAAGR